MEVKRGEGKIKECLVLKDSYEYYKKNTSSEKPISYSEYSKYIKLCNLELLNNVVEEMNEVELPYRLGTLQINKFDRSYTQDKSKWAVDFKKTKELGFKVYFDQKYTYRWRWVKTHCIVRYKSKYKFTASRMAKRMVPKALAKNKDYFKIK
jgi:hypothetical protein